MRYEFKHIDHRTNEVTVEGYYTKEAATCRLREEWECHANFDKPDFLVDLEMEADGDEWRCYVESGDNSAYGVLTHLDDDAPTHEWWVTDTTEREG